MATKTIGDQITEALRLLGVLAEGETPSAPTAQDALNAFNQMVDSWSTERLSVYTTIDQVFDWLPGFRTRTLGPTGDFVGQRPISLDYATYFEDISQNLSYSIQIVNQEQYNSIGLKTSTGAYPQILYVNMGYPDVEISVWPVPSTQLKFHFVSVMPLAEATEMNTVLAFPPGYLRAIAYNLAVEIAPMFGIAPPADVSRIAIASKRNLKRINNPMDVLSMPSALVSRNRGAVSGYWWLY